MSPNKGSKMTSDWLLQILLVAVSILGGGAVWYFISQKQFHHALWSGLAAAILLLVVVALFIRNDIIKREIQAKTPTYFGELVPSNEPCPPLPTNAPKGTITPLLGDDLRVLALQSQNYIFSKRGKPFLSIGITKGLMRVNASIVDSNNQQ